MKAKSFSKMFNSTCLVGATLGFLGCKLAVVDDKSELDRPRL